MSKSWESLFSCDKCGEPLAIKVIKGHKDLVTVGKCTKGHKKRFILSISELDEWAPALDPHFFKCVRCDTPVSVTPLHRGPWVKVIVTCPVHGKNEIRLVPIRVYNAMPRNKELATPAPAAPAPAAPTPAAPTPAAPAPAAPAPAVPTPACQNCGGPTTFIPQYSRYYCYKCERYVEDKKVVEKVRAITEPEDLRSKLKNFAKTADKNIPISIFDLPTRLNMPNVDSAKIESLLTEMIIQSEINGEVDPATGDITLFEVPIITKPAAATTTSKPACATCGSNLDYVEAKEAYFCRTCFEYTEAAPAGVPTPVVAANIEAVRDFDYVGGQVRFKIAVRNKSELVVTNIGVDLDIPPEFQLIRILPEASVDDLKRGLSKIDKLMPNSSQGIDYYLEPVACGTGAVAGLVKYQDAQGTYGSIPVKPREIAIKCPLIFTPEEANIAMIRNLTKNLTSDYRRWALPTNPPDSFTFLHDLVNQFEVNHIQAFQISGDPYKVESWYYTRTKTTNHPIAIQIVVSEQTNTIDLTIACEDMSELTGLLAKMSEDFREKIYGKLHVDLKPVFGSLKELICDCGSPLSRLPSDSEVVTCNSCNKTYSWEMLSY
ncbi:MAG: hypothetical protein HWN65_14640 [Candidatus Helarchaeota archaeon]|nr:hypothetical protein [Candidatus Helarchaeota archaeon]